MARVTAQQAKQVVKNALYRTIGETSTALRLRPDGQKTLSILMYHKVNDFPDNPTTVPVASFDEQLARLGELGYNVVDLDAVLDHYTLGDAAAREGGADHLRRRLPRHARERAAGAPEARLHAR